jgi:hypothetical protein
MPTYVHQTKAEEEDTLQRGRPRPKPELLQPELDPALETVYPRHPEAKRASACRGIGHHG